jgi:hypothetical protein
MSTYVLVSRCVLIRVAELSTGAVLRVGSETTVNEASFTDSVFENPLSKKKHLWNGEILLVCLTNEVKLHPLMLDTIYLLTSVQQDEAGHLL